MRRMRVVLGQARSTAAVFVVLALLSTGCNGATKAADRPGRPTSSTSVAPSASPADDPPQPAEAFADAFVSFDGFAFEDAPRDLVRSQLRPIEASVDGFGRVVDSNVKVAVKRGEVGVTVTIVGIKQTKGNTAQDVFGALLASVSMREQPEPAAGGQAFKIDTGATHIFLTPVATEPYLLLLMVICPEDAPGEMVVEGMLAALSS